MNRGIVRVAAVAFAALGPLVVLRAQDGTPCYRQAALQPWQWFLDECDDYVECPSRVLCVTGDEHQTPGVIVSQAAACRQYTGGTPDGEGGCVGGTEVIPPAFSTPEPVPYQDCYNACPWGSGGN